MLIVTAYSKVYYDICLSDGIHQCMPRQFCIKNITNTSNVSSHANNLRLKFCSTSYFLHNVLLFSNNSMVTIEGHPTVIHCKTSDSGIHITQVSNLTIRDVCIKQCGTLFNALSNNIHHLYFASSVYIYNSSNITINSVIISSSKGSGLLMINNKGAITINNCNFEGSSPRTGDDVLENGVGLHIELSFCGQKRYHQHCNESQYDDVQKSSYTIMNSSFFNNDGTGANAREFTDNSPSAWGNGGGIAIAVSDYSYQIGIIIVRCNITHNRATRGGGLYLAINQHSMNIEVFVEDTLFFGNVCPNNAGGGVNVGFLYPSKNNSVHFSKCQFIDNNAYYGGGLSFYASKYSEGYNEMYFSECSWTGNKATFGAAADFSPQNRDSGVFDLKVLIEIHNCNFTNNKLLILSNDSQRNSGKGTVWIQGLQTVFSGQILSVNNYGSALYAISSRIKFLRNSNILFQNNSGFQGGAIALVGFSIMIYGDDCTFQFINNVAQDGGGAIFHIMYSKRDIHASRTCFIQSAKNGCKNTQFIFKNNSGSLKGRNNTDLSHFGHSIYSTTLMPCYYSKIDEHESITLADMFTSTGNFTFVDRNEHDLSTSEYSITINTTIVHAIPGKHFKLPIETVDEFRNQIATVFHVFVNNIGKSNISVSKAYTYISNNRIRFHGRPGDKANITFKTTTIREKTIEFEVGMWHCPPGYVHNKFLRACICSADIRLYEGITSCNRFKFQSKLSGGYWAGYSISNSSRYATEYSDLLLSYCPQSQCFADSLDAIEHTLPNTSSREELDDLICGGAHRTGILCSRCREGYAIHYHSGTNQCKQVMNKCRLGWLYYILSEIVPVTLVFLVITIFGIKLTSGSIGGFILFTQISVTMRIRNNGHIAFPEFTEQALNVYMSIASMFRLSFFNSDRLSFCLWASASNLDILTFKYITIFYALLLILGIVAVVKCCNIKITSKFSYSKVQQDYSSSIIHGISGFLVICYSECTRISLFLLTPAWLYSMSVENGAYWIKSVPFYDGTLDYFRENHLAYALPALFIFLSIGIVSPLLLLSYPLCYKILACLRLNESKLLKVLCLVIPLEKCKPFFDSFQSCYHDNCRFFSGLYFMYRLTTLIAFAFISKPLIFYIILETQFVLMLLAQVLFQPHRNKWHGISDALLFANLSIINLLTMLNQNLSYYPLKKKYINVISTIQVVLLYVPLIYSCIYLAQKIVHRISCKKKEKKAVDDYHQLSSLTTSLINAIEERSN